MGGIMDSYLENGRIFVENMSCPFLNCFKLSSFSDKNLSSIISFSALCSFGIFVSLASLPASLDVEESKVETVFGLFEQIGSKHDRKSDCFRPEERLFLHRKRRRIPLSLEAWSV